MFLSASAYGAEAESNVVQGDFSAAGGTYCKNAVTRETYYIPEPDIEAHSDETFGFSPGYNPFADEDNDVDSSLQPYYWDSGRDPVPNPQNNEKCRNTVCIEFKYIDPKTNTEAAAHATGFMIGPNAVATAGHCVFSEEAFAGDHWITESTIIPACNTGYKPKPFGTAKGIEYRCGWNWANGGDHSDDWGIIILDWNIGNSVGWLGLQYQSAPYGSGTAAYLNGYPGEVNGHENVPRDQYTRSGTVKTISEANLLESRDMFASSGDSGGPCYIYSGSTGYTAIAIASHISLINHNEYNINFVRFRTIDKSLYMKLVEFRTSTL